MERLVYNHFLMWKISERRKPLILRGARQVGKTHIVRKFGEEAFPSFIEINFERSPEAKHIFEQDFSPQRIIRDLSLLTNRKIIVGETLLFFDEIQEAPSAIKALRYFFEEMPALHVVAAGSLLEFGLDSIGIPVGRVDFLYMYPMSFIEFLMATDNYSLAREIVKHQIEQVLNEAVHDKILNLLGVYMAVGGMPEAVKAWVETQDLNKCSKIHNNLIDAYRQDFQKYTKKFQIKYVDLLFNRIPFFLGKPFKYSNISSEYRTRELEPCLDLLVNAGIIHRVIHSPGNGVPLKAEANLNKFKTIFIDIALTQTISGVKTSDWILNAQQSFINKGAITEAFVGQELLAYSHPSSRIDLYYWQRHQEKNTPASSSAEVDYLFQKGSEVIPIEVKSDHGNTLKSLKMFLQTKKNSPYGIRFSKHNYSKLNHIRSYPLYAIAGAFDFSKGLWNL